MGFQGISPSFGISFDTHHNPSDETAEDHISFHKDGNIAELCNQHVNLTNIEDDSDHKMMIMTTDITTKMLMKTYYFVFMLVKKMSVNYTPVNKGYFEVESGEAFV